ncbi:hypothetical protein [Sphingomonas bisphenolicum]|uniref:Uncharacterized protein n=1 Tax=Sphingomonas bisphenolicum TaxID=296544 RepID=A0ABN5WGA9_9SPHN|nr:hypothetical protein [Sphingomonas bisphenolicum]BBF70102.1 hypothetical protein SBA_ch1_23020 [Sphingomonas bisphenolicum]
MDKLEEAFTALAAHIDLHAPKGPFNGFVEVAKDLGMEMEDLSDGSDIHQVLSMGHGEGKLTLIYLLVPVDEDEPLDENYWLELSGRGARSHAKVWHFKDGKLANKEPIPKAA